MTSKKTHAKTRRFPAIPWFYPLFLLFVLPFESGHAAGAPALAWIDIATANGPHRFHVEVMRTPQERAQGLMFRKSLESDHGMLFDFETETAIRMWMKNTYIPLDMIFISESLTIVDIARDTVPHSTEIIASGPAARYVLEVNAGTSARLQIHVGDRVSLSSP